MMVSVGLLLLNHLLAWFYNHISTIEAGEIFYLLWHDYDDGKFEEEVPCFAVKTDIIANDYDYFNLPGKAIKSACRVVMTQMSKDYKLEFFLGSTNLSIKDDVGDTIGIKSITFDTLCIHDSLAQQRDTFANL